MKKYPLRKRIINVDSWFSSKLWETMLFFSSFPFIPWRLSKRFEHSLNLLALWIHLKLVLGKLNPAEL